jgi:tetratricopeptide (TPR) repeat protein
VLEVEKVIQQLLLLRKTKEEWLDEGAALSGLKRYEEALPAYEQAIRLDPNYVFACNNKGNALYGLKRYEEAKQAWKRAKELGYS